MTRLGSHPDMRGLETPRSPERAALDVAVKALTAVRDTEPAHRLRARADEALIAIKTICPEEGKK